MFGKVLRILGDSNDKALKGYWSLVDEINAHEAEFLELSDEELAAKTQEFKGYLEGDGELSDVLEEAFAVVREASRRSLGMRHFDVQLVGGMVLHEGKIAEMKTGEGKTLVATLPAYLNALTGDSVHVVTVNDYLARRDAQWMGPVYHLLGLKVGILQHDGSYLFDPSAEAENPTYKSLTACSRQDAYAAEITYGTNNEFGFDYLRDNMVADPVQRVQRDHSYAIVDEIDNILVDEARTPLIISGQAKQGSDQYQTVAQIAPRLQEPDDYAIEEKHKVVTLTETGISRVEKALGVGNLYDPANYQLVRFVENALKAQVFYQKDVQYVVNDGEVILVDEFTGRLMSGRRLADGLHQAIEAKEGLKIQQETVTYATITLQNYFRMYPKLSGMTGTAATEAEEFWKIYTLDVVTIPTNMPMLRKDEPDLIYSTETGKIKAVAEEIEEQQAAGRPVLVGTVSIEKSELLSDVLRKRGVSHEVLNAKNHEREATIIAQAGRPGAVTVATNMAGRGTDIVLGGNYQGLNMVKDEWERDHQRVIELGGLYIIGTERHEARRIDNQLRGRAGRQGDPGETRFFISLEDELIRRFGGDRIKGVMEWAGMDEETPLENRFISKAVENAQVRVEAYHFDMRKHLVEYDDVINRQREVIYDERLKVLSGADLKTNIQEMIHSVLDLVMSTYLPNEREEWNVTALLADLGTIFALPPELTEENIANMDREDLSDGLHKYADEYYEQREQEMGSEVARMVERLVMLRVIDSLWVQHLTAMENLRQGIGLHAAGQRDPLMMYKKESHEYFDELLSRIQHDVAHTIYRVTLTRKNDQHQREQGTRQPTGVAAAAISRETPITAVGDQHRGRTEQAVAKKIGRNDPCHCGSGKKYKKCHGMGA
jgi:preprotein translocase subunit SecA